MVRQGRLGVRGAFHGPGKGGGTEDCLRGVPSGPSLLITLLALHLRRVLPHLHADQNLDIARVPRRTVWSRRSAGGNSAHVLSSSSRALFSSARHCRSVVSRLRLSPIFAAARQPGSTLRLGTLS